MNKYRIDEIASCPICFATPGVNALGNSRNKRIATKQALAILLLLEFPDLRRIFRRYSISFCIGSAWGGVKDETLGRKNCSQHGPLPDES